jgi:AraC-like DNA-binding protein
MALIISPYQQQEWHVTIDDLDYTFLIFQEEFINNFLSDKYFMYRLLYCYQNELPTCFDMTTEEMAPFHELSRKMRHELLEPIADSYHMIVAYLYQFLLRLNRFYAHLFELPFSQPQNNYAYQYKLLLEKNIRHKNRVSDYAEMIGISRISLNKAVEREFGVTATHLLKRRLLQEIKDHLLFTDLPIKEIAYKLNFSEPNHLARFFKQQTGETISEFIASTKR